MPAAWVSAGVGALGLLAGSRGGGGGGTQTTTADKSPWAPAAPWMQQNIDRGQQLQKFYQDNPFSNTQKQAYGNQFALNDSYNQMMPQLMAGMNQPGFNRSNPTARPTPQNFTPPQSMNLGLMGSTSPFSQGAPAAPVVAANPQQSAMDQILAQWQAQQARQTSNTDFTTMVPY